VPGVLAKLVAGGTEAEDILRVSGSVRVAPLREDVGALKLARSRATKLTKTLATNKGFGERDTFLAKVRLFCRHHDVHPLP
jgi:hypothetical protein